MTTHSALWRRAVEEAYQRPGADSRLSLALVDQEADDGLGMADEDGAVREADGVCPDGNGVCGCPKNVEGNR